MKSAQSVLNASGIRCEGCATAVRKALGQVPGVVEAAVNVPEKKVTITHAPETPRADLVAALTKAGFPAE
jgi:copper chaperone CopZ